MSGQRVADYFIIAGLPENPVPLDDVDIDSQLKPTSKNEPITDICVIIPNDGEECPPGYKPLLETPDGNIADLNHGSIRSPEVFICYRRGRDKAPLTDVGVLYEGSERVLAGCEVVYTTPYGRPANVNNTNSRIYLTYRRAADTASSDTLAVTDICVINTSKGEKAPHSFCKIDKNLNQSMMNMMSSSIYLCYKKSMCKDYSIGYKPAVLGRYPMWDWPDFPLSEHAVAMFGLPMGAVLESWPEKATQPKPVFSTFVLTGVDGKKVYGAAVTFYELFKNTESMSDAQKKALGLHLKKKRLVHHSKAICLLAKKPFFDAFKMFLNFLFKQTLSKDTKEIPIEKFISHFMWNVPYPTPERPRVLVPLSNDCEVHINLPDESPIPLSGASFVTMLRNIGVENTISLLSMTLLEKKILIHSLRPAVLTGVIEAVGSMIFPFSWQCPYVPLCPLGLADVLYAPVPYIVGVDSRYFDLYDPPVDVTCIDLDTNTISKPSDNKLLPKRPAKVLRSTLEKIYTKILQDQRLSASQTNADDLKKIAAQNAMETSIQEAFLRFMAAMLKGYKNFLLPIGGAPTDQHSTSVKELFDLKGFLKSRDKAYHKLYDQIVRTQAFTRFIEERSFNIRDDTSLLFFDECTEKVDENYDTPKLLETDPYKSEHTVFVSPPNPDDSVDPPVTYSYDSFPSTLDYDLFPYREPPPISSVGVVHGQAPDKKSFIARRSKAEVKAALKLASMSRKGIAASTLWSKCLVNNSFSLWFIHLPSFIQVSQESHSAMRAACAVLKKMQEYRLHTPDERHLQDIIPHSFYLNQMICFRAMMQLCGIYKLPVLAVKVLCEMRSIGLNANAVTYGYYNQAVLEGKWPSDSVNSKALWRRIRHLVMGVSQFRRALKNRRHSMDLDSVSRGSEESSEVTLDTESSNNRKDDRHSTTSDKGYSSMSQEDIHKDTFKINHSTTHNKSAVISEVENEAFRAKVGSIIRRSVASKEDSNGHNMTGSHLESSAGLLITARRIVRKVPLGGSLNASDRAAFVEARRKRHKSAGDHLKRKQQTTDAGDLGCVPLDQTDTSLIDVSDELSSLTPSLDTDCTSSGSGNSVLTVTANSDTVSNGKHDSVELIDIQSGSVTIGDSKRSEKQTLIDKGIDRQSMGGKSMNSLESAMFDPLTGATESSTQSSDKSSKKGADSMSASMDSLKKQTVVSDDPLGLFSAQTPDISKSTPKSATLASTNTQQPAVTMDIGNLFGRESPKKPNTNGTADVKKYNLLELSPENEHPPALETPQLRKSLSLDSRNSYKAAIKEDDAKSADAILSSQQPSTDRLINKRDSIESKESLDSMGSSGNLSLQDNANQQTPSYKDWMKNSLKKSTSLALNRTHLSKVKSLMYGSGSSDKPKQEPTGALSSHESIDSVGLGTTATPKAIKRDSVTSSMKKLKSVSNSMASKLYSSYNKVKHTVKEYQAPSTVSTPYKEEKQADSRSNDDNISILSSHSIGGPANGAEEYISALDDGNKPFDAKISYTGISSDFISTYLADKAAIKPASCDVEDDVDEAFLPPSSHGLSNGSLVSCIMLEVVMCSATLCEHCSSILYDEDIMAGWSAQDSDLNTICRFCERKQVPFLSVELRDPKSTDRQSLADDSVLTSPKSPRAKASGMSPIKVPYLSPLVLRKELERVLESEGDVALTLPQFVDSHAIIYWNLVWYFKRMNVPTHLPQLLFSSETLQFPHMKTGYLKASNMSLRVVWDNPKLHDVMVSPLYKQWNDSGVKSSVVRALLTDEKAKSKGFMQQILTYVECNDMYTPLKQILINRRLANPSERCQSAYRDILFLSFMYFGRDVMDHDAFDREYKLAFKKLSPADRQYLHVTDFPPTPTVIWCRKLFGNLDVV